MGVFNNSQNNRDLTIDTIKILCTFWIVGFWHLSSYGNVFSSHITLGYEITASVMGIFMFFSGYFLSKYETENLEDVFAFYKKRLSRFYILYLISIATLYIGGLFTIKPWFKNNLQLFLSCFGLSGFYNPNVATLWFMSMLMFFYLITPIINIKKNCFWKAIIGITFLFLFIAYDYYFADQLDTRFIYLYILYFLGLLIPHYFIDSIKKKWYYSIIGFLIFWYLASNPYIENQTINKTIYSIGFILFTVYLTELFRSVHNKIINIESLSTKIITKLSFCSLTVYLFHRQIYQILLKIFNKLHFNINIYVLYLIFVPTAYIISYIIQHLYNLVYDKTLKRLNSNIRLKIED